MKAKVSNRRLMCMMTNTENDNRNLRSGGRHASTAIARYGSSLSASVLNLDACPDPIGVGCSMFRFICLHSSSFSFVCGLHIKYSSTTPAQLSPQSLVGSTLQSRKCEKLRGAGCKPTLVVNSKALFLKGGRDVGSEYDRGGTCWSAFVVRLSLKTHSTEAGL